MTVIDSILMKAGAIQIQCLAGQLQMVDNLNCKVQVQVADASVVQAVESPAKYLVVQVFGLYTIPDETINRLILKKLREQVQSLPCKAQAIDDHCNHRLSNSGITNIGVICDAGINVSCYL